MKLIGIGDLLIPSRYIEEGFSRYRAKGVDVEVVDWPLKDYEELQSINLQVETQGSEVYAVPDALIAKLRDAEILITQFCPITKKVIDACTKLRFIGVLRGGYENVNVSYAVQKGITVYHTPGRNATAVADFTVGMILGECRNIARAHANLKEGRWVRDYANAASVPDLEDKTVGIIGLGQVGQKVAKRLRGFDVRLIGYDPYVDVLPDDVTRVSFDDLLVQADFVTIHGRLTEETKGLMNARAFSLMKPTAYFINTARAGLVDEAALYAALKEKRIQGAALDVFEHEPLTGDDPLVGLDNVTITPHLAGGTVDAFLHSPVLLSREMEGSLSGDLTSRCIVRQK
ncbi:2-hydroxyacid dehydrogenase [Selenomonas felix]|uniref:2-hydroxyacid dehydrogenase n=1 Tax=Selenomonas felix TaxID=1944634 RepID=UPI002352DD1F|nr:2-hydroxyacid dehydrogenase [Selenomonas felix]